MSTSPKLGPYNPLALPQVQVFSIKEFAIWRARYISCIAHLHNITSSPLNEGVAAQVDVKEDRKREVKETCCEAVGIMKGLVGFLEFVLKDGGIVELDEWCLREVSGLREECEWGVGVMRVCLESSEMGTGLEGDLCRGLRRLWLHGRES